MAVAEIILNFLFPRRCVSCGKVGAYLCPHCLSKIILVETPICPVCERPAIGGATHPVCQTRYSLDGLISISAYDGPMRIAIKRLKYRPWISDLGENLVSLIIFYLREKNLADWLISGKVVLVPVPLYKDRQRERGFNQSEILGKLLAQKLSLSFWAGLLLRNRNTKPQAELKGKERQENIKNAFAVNHNSQFIIHNSNILLIDDIWTTGSTLRTCAQVLKRAGFKRVWALTLAR